MVFAVKPLTLSPWGFSHSVPANSYIWLPFQLQHSSNDNTIFLLDYLYCSVYEVGCRWFFDHNLLMFVYIYIYLLTTNSLLHLRLLYTKFYSSDEKQFTYPSSETTTINVLFCLLFWLSIYLIAELYLAPLDILVFSDFIPSKIIPIE